MRSVITSFSNSKVKWARSLREKKHRKPSGKFLVEGLRLLTEARDHGFIPEMLFLDEKRDAHPLITQLEHDIEQAGGEIIATTADILSKISGKKNPQTLVGVFSDFPTPLAQINRHDADIWLVAENMRDPGNLGTMLRTGDAVGAGGLILIDNCVDPFSVEAVRASMGAIFTQKIAMATWAEFHGWARTGDAQLVATHLEGAVDYRAADYQSPCFIVIGNEAQGLPNDYTAQCDVRVKIPMLGQADSLNAAVAGAVIAYQVLDKMRPI